CLLLHAKPNAGSFRRAGRRRASRRSIPLHVRLSRKLELGAVTQRSVGSFSYKKRLKNGGVVVCDVRVFALEVRRQSNQWPEKQERIIKWLSASQAAEKVDEPRLGEIIRRLARKYDGRNPIEQSGDPIKSKF